MKPAAGLAAVLLGSIAIALGVGVAASAPAEPPASIAAEVQVIGHSVQGRPITAVQLGDPAAERVALVVGLIHGDEHAGLRIVDRVEGRASEIQGVQLWVIPSVNPDGARAHARKNAHGVDLNRNFPYRWRGGLPHSDGYYPGPEPASEPETRAVIDFVRQIKPQISIWYHQPWGAVLACHGRPRSPPATRSWSDAHLLPGQGVTGDGDQLGERRGCPERRPSSSSCPRERSAAPAARRHAGAAIALAEGG